MQGDKISWRTQREKSNDTKENKEQNGKKYLYMENRVKLAEVEKNEKEELKFRCVVKNLCLHFSEVYNPLNCTLF